MSILTRLRDRFGRYLPNTPQEEVAPETDSLPDVQRAELVTTMSTDISINGRTLDLTELTREDAVVLYNFGILKPEHFNAICKMEGWHFDEDIDFDEEDEDWD